MIRIRRQEDLGTRNTFRMRVRCACWVETDREEDLVEISRSDLPRPLLVVGGGSNLLFTGDFPGTVLHPAFGADDTPVPVQVPGGWEVTLGAGKRFDDFCAWAASEGYWGPENLSLIPGDVGAAAVQNIGAYGVEAADLITGIRAYDLETGEWVHIHPEDCSYGYRTSRFKTDWKGRYIITAVTFRLSRDPAPRLDYGGVRAALQVRFPDAPPTPERVRETVIAIRRTKLPDPDETGSAGSYFCNPVVPVEVYDRIAEAFPDGVPHYPAPGGIKIPAAWLIERCGLKGRRIGGARVWDRQPLILVNETGEAVPGDILALENLIIRSVSERFGIRLRPEVEHIPS